MKFERTAHFKRDFRKLPEEHKDQFPVAARQFHDAASRAAHGDSDPWPNGLRVKSLQGAPGIWEMTWSKKRPDGRATWEWVTIDQESSVRWRRVGDHRVLGDP